MIFNANMNFAINVIAIGVVVVVVVVAVVVFGVSGEGRFDLRWRTAAADPPHLCFFRYPSLGVVWGL